MMWPRGPFREDAKGGGWQEAVGLHPSLQAQEAGVGT